MTETTPKRSISKNTLSPGFSPISLHESPAAASPQRNLTGVPRVVRDLAADVYNNIQRWNDLHIKGTNIVKQIASLKADNPQNFSSALEELVNELLKTVENLEKHVKLLASYYSQIRSLSLLHKDSGPLFISLSVEDLAKLVEDISKAYQAEYEVKVFILENIAYVKNKDEAIFMAALWTYQYKIPETVNLILETLLVETGHRKIN